MTDIIDIQIPARRMAAPPPRRGPRLWLWLLLLTAGLFLAPPAAVLLLRWLPPPTTAFMLQSEVKPVQYQWVPATAIAESARKAAVAAEDQKFWTHNGFDFEAISKALEHNEKSRRKRGASTITQQVAKNLFLWPGRSWLRKGVEVSFTVLIEWFWPKPRILEVYLNIAEFGPGIYGVEAAAQKFFDKPAAALLPAEAAQLAAVLPNPRKWRADRPGPYVQSRAAAILRLMGGRPPPAGDEPEEPPLDLPDEPRAEPLQPEAPVPEPSDEPPPIETTPHPGSEPPQTPISPEEPTPENPPPNRAALGPRSV